MWQQVGALFDLLFCFQWTKRDKTVSHRILRYLTGAQLYLTPKLSFDNLFHCVRWDTSSLPRLSTTPIQRLLQLDRDHLHIHLATNLWYSSLRQMPKRMNKWLRQGQQHSLHHHTPRRTPLPLTLGTTGLNWLMSMHSKTELSSFICRITSLRSIFVTGAIGGELLWPTVSRSL